MFDDTSTIVLVNPAVTRIFGYSAEELIGRPLTVLMPERFAAPHLAGMRRYVETGQRHVRWSGLELTAVRKTGEEFPVDISFAEVARGDRRMFTGFIRDITERKRLLEAQGELARVARIAVLGEFAASIAHEVRQPLTAIMMNSRTCLRLLAAPAPDLHQVREALTELVEAARRAGEVIRRNRELVEHHTVQKISLDINEVIQDVATLVKSRLRVGRVALTMRLADVPRVYGDRIELQQVLLNLIANGIDAMERRDSGSRMLNVESRVAPEEMVSVSGLELSDHG